MVLRASTIGFPYEKAEGVPKCARVYEEACKNIATSYLPAYVRYCLLFKTSRKPSQPVLSIYARRPSSFSGWAESYAEDKANSFPCSPKTWSSIMSSLSPSLSSKPIALLADLINGGPNQILSERLSLLEGKERKERKNPAVWMCLLASSSHSPAGIFYSPPPKIPDSLFPFLPPSRFGLVEAD